MKADDVTGVELLVLHDTPARLRSFLDEDALGRLSIIDPEVLDQRPAGHRDLEEFDCSEVDRSILCLPIDGPRSAARAAIDGLMRDAIGSIVAPSSTGGGPPPWWSLELASSSGMLAVDLRRAPWHDHLGLWWADGAGPRRVPVTVRGRGAQKQAAGILGALLDRGRVHGIMRWLDDVAGGGRSPGAAEWDTILCANYLTHALEFVLPARGL